MPSRIYPLTKKTVFRAVECQDDSKITGNFTFFDTSGRSLFTVIYGYNRVTHNEYAGMYITENRTLLSVRKDTLKKAIAHIAHEIGYDTEVLYNKLYQSLQDRGLYSAARVYHKKIFEKG